MPEPVAVIQPAHHEELKPVVLPVHTIPVMKPQIMLPDLKLQGVIVGEEIHQAIINDQVVPLLGTIMGAQIVSVSKQGVALLFKGKKFFLKVD